MAIVNQLSPSDAAKAVRREMALQTLEEHGVIIHDGHFDYGNGWHGTFYINPHQIVRRPARLWQLAQDLLDQVPVAIQEQIEVVAGQATGGAMLGHVIAGLLDGKHDPKHPAVEFARFESSRYELSTLKPFYAEVMRGKKILLVDDVINTGKTLSRCAQLATESGGTVLALAALYDRLEQQVELTPKPIVLAEYKAPKNFPAEDCLLCDLGVAITRF